MKKYNRVKAALFEKNVKQSELADHLGKSRASVYRICDNRSQPHLAELHRIATYLNIPVCDLINDPPE